MEPLVLCRPEDMTMHKVVQNRIREDKRTYLPLLLPPATATLRVTVLLIASPLGRSIRKVESISFNIAQRILAALQRGEQPRQVARPDWAACRRFATPARTQRNPPSSFSANSSAFRSNKSRIGFASGRRS